MTERPDQAMFEFFADLPQQGPGTDATTRKVLLSIRHDLPPRPAVADFGCGTGRSTMVLAAMLDTTVAAVERAPEFCERLRINAAERGLSDRIVIHQADMGQPPISAGSLDLIWSEGSAYALGFASALRNWRPLLKPNGYCVVSECTWLRDDIPAAAERFWNHEYPQMTTLAGNCALARQAGYSVETTIEVPREGWEDYYQPIEAAIRAGAAEKCGPGFATALLDEKAIFDSCGDYYGYVFYVLRNTVP